MSLPIKSDVVELVSGGAADPKIVAGTADPTAGFAGPEGSIYLRYGASAGKIYVKSGPANIDWGQVAISGGGAGTLDQAYDFGGAGLGRTITADAGAVQLDAFTTDTQAALTINRTPGAAAAAIGIDLALGANFNASGIGLKVTDAGAGTSLKVAKSNSGSAVLVDLTNIGAKALEVTVNAAPTSVSPVSIVANTTGTTVDLISVSKIPGAATAGNALSVSMGANTTGSGIYVSQAGSGPAIEVASGSIQVANSAAAVSPSNTGRIRYNSTTQTFQVSLNGGAYTDIQTGAEFTLDIGDAIGSSTVGSVLFVGAGNLLAQDNAQLFWDNTNDILGVGTATPGLFADTKLEVFKSTGHCVASIITLGTNNDAVLILGTFTPGDAAMFLDESDSMKLKFAIGDVSTDAGRNTNTKITLQTNGNVGIGTTTIGNWRLQIHMDQSGQECLKLRATHVAAYSDMVWFDSADVQKGGIGYANASVANTLASRNFFYSPGAVDWVMSDATTDWFRWYATTNSVGFEIANGSSATASAASTGKLRYNTTGQKAQWSFNGGAYFDVGTYAAALTTGSIPFANASNQLAQDNATLFWDDTNNQLGVGTASPGGSSLGTELIARLTRVGTALHGFVLIESGTAPADAGLALYTATVGEDFAMFLDESDSRRLKLATGSVDTDANRNTNTKLTLQQNGVLTIAGVAATNSLILTTGNILVSNGQTQLTRDHATDGQLFLQGSNAGNTQPSAIGFLNQAASFRSYVGYFPSAYAFTHLQLLNGWLSQTGEDIAFANTTENAFRFGMTTATAYMAVANGSSAAVSATSTGRLRYNTTGQKFQASHNTGAYFDVATYAAALTTGSILFANASNQLAQDNANLFFDDTNNRLGLGTAAPDVALDLATGTAEAGIQFRIGTTLPVSAASTGRIRYNATSQLFQISKNTAAYEDMASLATAQTFTKSQNVAAVALTDAANIATDASLGNTFTVTLAGNRTLDDPTNLVSGGVYRWVITQDATGSRTLAYGTLFKWPGGTAPVLTTAANAVDSIEAVYNGTSLLATFTLNYS